MPREKGTYLVNIEGVSIVEGLELGYDAAVNYPVEGPGIPRTVMGIRLTTVLIVIALAIAGVVAVVLVRSRRIYKPEKPAVVNDLYEFEGALSDGRSSGHKDYSYLSQETTSLYHTQLFTVVHEILLVVQTASGVGQNAKLPLHRTNDHFMRTCCERVSLRLQETRPKPTPSATAAFCRATHLP